MKETEACADTCEKLFAQYCPDPNMALELAERLRFDLYGAASDSSPAFILQSFAERLDYHKAAFAFGQIKDQVREYRSALFRELMLAQIRQNHTVLDALEACAKGGFKAPELDVLLTALSGRSFDFIKEKEKLYQAFERVMREAGFCAADCTSQRSLFDTFFYGKGGIYDTVYIRRRFKISARVRTGCCLSTGCARRSEPSLTASPQCSVAIRRSTTGRARTKSMGGAGAVSNTGKHTVTMSFPGASHRWSIEAISD